MSGSLWVGVAIVGWLLAGVAVTLWQVTRRQAREAQKREQVQAAIAGAAVEKARLMEADAQRWRDRDGGDRRIAEQFAGIAEDMPEMADVGRHIREQAARRRVRRIR